MHGCMACAWPPRPFAVVASCWAPPQNPARPPQTLPAPNPALPPAATWWATRASSATASPTRAKWSRCVVVRCRGAGGVRAPAPACAGRMPGARITPLTLPPAPQMWAEKEMRNLARLHAAGILCPKPLQLRLHVLGACTCPPGGLALATRYFEKPASKPHLAPSIPPPPPRSDGVYRRKRRGGAAAQRRGAAAAAHAPGVLRCAIMNSGLR